MANDKTQAYRTKRRQVVQCDPNHSPSKEEPSMRHQLQFLRVVFVAIALFFSLTGIAVAQETTGSIVGTLRDANGATVSGAKVTINDPARGFQRNYETTGDGSFTIPDLQPSLYTLTVEKQGFKKYVQENLRINVNDRRLVDIALEVGQVSETVTIQTDVPLIQQSPTQQGLISGAQIRDLPLNTRNFVALALLSAGVSANNASQIGSGALSV